MDYEVSSDNFYISQTHSASTFEQFRQKLKEHETATGSKYIFVKSTKKFEDAKVALTKPNLRIHWQDNVPYLNLGSIVYVCHQGKDTNLYNKKKYAENRELKGSKCYRRTVTTKKMNCPVKIMVTRVLKFVKHKLTGEISRSRRDRCSTKLKMSIKNGADLEGEECCIFNLPTEEEHKYHLTGQQSVKLPRGGKSNNKKKAICSMRVKSAIKNSTDLGEECHIFNLPTEEEHTYHLTVQHGGELPRGGSSEHKHQLINKINSTISSIQSVLCDLHENELVQANDVLKNLLKMWTSKINNGDSNKIPIEAPVGIIQSSCQNSREKTNSKLTLQRKRGYNGRDGVKADKSRRPQSVYVLEEGIEGPCLKKLNLIPISCNNIS